MSSNEIEKIKELAKKYKVNIYNDETFIKKIENLKSQPYKEIEFAQIANLFLWLSESENSAQKSSS